MKNKLQMFKGVENKGKLKFALATMALTTSVGLSAFSVSSDVDNEKEKINFENDVEFYSKNFNNSTKTDYEINDTSKNKIDYNEIYDDFTFVSDKDNSVFNEYLDGFSNDYSFDELYNTKNVLDKYEKNKFSANGVVHSRDLFKGKGKVDVSELYKSVLENNENYLKTEKKYIYENLSKRETKKICGIIADTVNTYIDKHPDIDLNELSCYLGNLKILANYVPFNAGVTNDGCLFISPNTLRSLQRKNNDIDTYTNTIMHESVHLIQSPCLDVEEANPGKNVGISYKYDDVDINPLDFNWLYEGGAEKCVTNLTGDNPLVYESEIDYINTLNLVSILKDDISHQHNEEISFYKDLEMLFDEFDCESKQEKEELINMMMSINVNEMTPTGFSEKYEEKYGVKFDSDTKSIIRAEIMTTLTKYFYRNLSNKLSDKKIPLEDVFYLIKVFESDINSYINFNSSNYYEYNKEFMDNYVEIQNEFFYSLSRNGKMNIASSFEDYEYITEKDNEYYQNYGLNWLNRDKKEFLEGIREQKENYSDISIRESLKNNKSKILIK